MALVLPDPLVRPLALAGDAVIELAARVSIFVDRHRRRPIRRAILGEPGGLQDVDEALALAAMDQRRAALDGFDREAICTATRRAGTNQFAPLAPQFQRGGFPLPVREAGC